MKFHVDNFACVGYPNAWFVAVITKEKPQALIDNVVAELLQITYKEYIKLLESFNAIKNRDFGYIFHSKQEAEKFVNYLNDNYAVILTLAEKG